MESTMRTLRILHVTFILTIILFAAVGEFLAPPRNKDLDIMLFPLSFVALADLGIGVFLRKSSLDPARETLRLNPSDAAAIEAWRRGHIISFVFAESIGMFGLMIRLVTGSREFALPFFVAGMAALILWAPRPPNA